MEQSRRRGRWWLVEDVASAWRVFDARSIADALGLSAAELGSRLSEPDVARPTSYIVGLRLTRGKFSKCSSASALSC